MGLTVWLRVELRRVEMATGASTYGGSVRFGFEGGLEVVWREEVKVG